MSRGGPGRPWRAALRALATAAMILVPSVLGLGLAQAQAQKQAQAQAQASPPDWGLLYNRSGLPATLPLLIRADQGTDFLVEILPPQGDAAPVMAALGQGGKPFRLLVPPGLWHIQLTLGQDWQGPNPAWGSDRAAGPAAHPGGGFRQPLAQLRLAEALEFGAGLSRKSGHLIDLRQGAPRIEDRGLCQDLRLDPRSLRAPWPLDPRAQALPPQALPPHERRFPKPDYRLVARLCD